MPFDAVAEKRPPVDKIPTRSQIDQEERAREHLLAAEAEAATADTWLKETIRLLEKGFLNTEDLQYLESIWKSDRVAEGTVTFLQEMVRTLEQAEQTPLTQTKICAMKKYLEAVGKFMAGYRLIFLDAKRRAEQKG